MSTPLGCRLQTAGLKALEILKLVMNVQFRLEIVMNVQLLLELVLNVQLLLELVLNVQFLLELECSVSFGRMHVQFLLELVINVQSLLGRWMFSSFWNLYQCSVPFGTCYQCSVPFWTCDECSVPLTKYRRLFGYWDIFLFRLLSLRFTTRRSEISWLRRRISSMKSRWQTPRGRTCMSLISRYPDHSFADFKQRLNNEITNNYNSSRKTINWIWAINRI